MKNLRILFFFILLTDLIVIQVQATRISPGLFEETVNVMNAGGHIRSKLSFEIIDSISEHAGIQKMSSGKWEIQAGFIATIEIKLPPPGLPTNLVGVPVSSTTIRWKWTNNSGTTFPSSFITVHDPKGKALSPQLTSDATEWLEFSLLPNATYQRFVLVTSFRDPVPTELTLQRSHAAAPIVNAITATTARTLSAAWDKNNNPDKTLYEIDASLFDDFSTIEASSSTNEGTDTMLTKLEYDTQYYVRVRAVNHDDIPTAYAIFKATITAPIPVPKLTLPLHKSPTKLTRPDFQWIVPPLDAIGFHYDYQLSNTQTFDLILRIRLDLVDQETSLKPFEALEDHTTYYWRVLSKDLVKVNSGKFSPVSQFVIDIQSAVILGAEALDLSGEGQIDALKISFNTDVDDNTFNPSSFSIPGANNFRLVHGYQDDLPGDSTLLIGFDDLPLGSAPPTLSYMSDTLKTTRQRSLNLVTTPLLSKDRVPPVLSSFEIRDDKILNKTTIIAIWAEPVIKTSVEDISHYSLWINSIPIDLSKSQITYDPSTRITVIEIPESFTDNASSKLKVDNIHDTVGNLRISWEMTSDFIRPQNVVMSISPQRLNVMPHDKIGITFDVDVDSTSLINSIKVTDIRNQSGQVMSLPIQGTLTYDISLKSAVWTPNKPWSKNHTYEIVLTTALRNPVGVSLDPNTSWTFTTIMDAKDFNVVQQDSNFTMEISPSALPIDTWLDIQMADPSGLSQNPSSNSPTSLVLQSALTQLKSHGFSSPVPNGLIEVTARDENDQAYLGSFSNRVLLKLFFEDLDDDGFIDQSVPPLKVSDLSIYWYNPSDKSFVLLPTSESNLTTNEITAHIPHFSVFAVLQSAGKGVTQSFAYPVPFVPSRNHRTITFNNIPLDTKISIYAVNGEIVKEIFEHDADGKESWDVRNHYGEKVASGVYIYKIRGGGETKTGKLVVIR